MREIIIQHVEQQPRDKTTGRNRTAGMAGKRRVVKHHRAKRAVNEIKRLAMIEGRFVERFAILRHAIGRVDEHAAARAERHDGVVSTSRRG
jgi:hypothetical protein